MYDTILVPTDGSEHSIRAAEHGSTLASAFDASMSVIAVADVDAAGGVFSAGGVDEEFVERLRAESETAIEAVLAAIDAPTAIETEVIQGTPSDAILEYAAASEADVIAMGTHGRTGIDRYIAGSVTERVVRLSDVPVLTVRAGDGREEVDGYDEILIPTDGSEAADAAVAHGLAIAERTGADVHAVSVIDVVDILDSPGDSVSAAYMDRLESAGEDATGRIASRARELGLDAVARVETGQPARTIQDYAVDHDIDLITMGTAGRTGVERYLLGSTTERVIRNAPMPVLAVTPEGTTEE